MFITCFLAIINTKTGEMKFSNAGHNPPHLLKDDGTVCELPQSKNTVVGAFDDLNYFEESLQLNHGDTLVMFTDGVNEAINSSNEEFGNARLDNIIRGLSNASSQQIIESVKDGIKEFVDGAEQSDDITMLVLKRK